MFSLTVGSSQSTVRSLYIRTFLVYKIISALNDYGLTTVDCELPTDQIDVKADPALSLER
jgi:hypothetical protein